MEERDVLPSEVKAVIEKGEIINQYPDDKPEPSFLILGWIRHKPLHLVVGQNPISQECVVISTYWPSETIWNPDYKTKKKP